MARKTTPKIVAAVLLAASRLIGPRLVRPQALKSWSSAWPHCGAAKDMKRMSVRITTQPLRKPSEGWSALLVQV